MQEASRRIAGLKDHTSCIAEIERMLELGEFSLAHRVAEKAKERYPNNYKINALLCEVYFLTGNLKYAEAYYRELSENYPEEPVPHSKLSEIYTVNGNIDLANKHKVLFEQTDERAKYERAINLIREAKSKNSTEIDLSGLKLKKIPRELLELKCLQSLNLASNKLSYIEPKLSELTNLLSLNLSGNLLTSIPEPIFRLSKLTKLSLSSNSIFDISTEMKKLSNLKELSIAKNNLNNISESVFELKNLEKLKLSDNNISEIPSNIKKLKNLEKLSLERNQIEQISPDIGSLKKLSSLNLKKNNVKNVPESAFYMPLLYRNGLNLARNPISVPPIEVLAKGTKSVREYFNMLSSALETDYLYEAKIILVGEGRVGKTALSKSILNDDYQLINEPSTEGIEVSDWDVPITISGEEKAAKVHIWDFGGQEIYHATHQFFLTTRSIYLYVLESRKDESREDMYYWLNIVKLLGGDSPVLVVVNKTDQPTDSYDIEEFSEYNKSVKELHMTSCFNKNGLKELQFSLRNQLALLEHFGTKVDKKWLTVKSIIDEKKSSGREFLSREEYEAICIENDISGDSLYRMSDLFHSMGIIIYFQDDIYLRNIIILNPEWATHAVYRVFDNHNGGRFSEQDLIKYLGKDVRFRYKENLILSLMKKFDLCFEIAPGKYIAPQLIDKQRPTFDWKSKADTVFEYEYDFMPKGILNYFTVKNHDEIHSDVYWRYGVLIERDGSKALLTENFHRKSIRVEVTGNNAPKMISHIRRAFNDIHSRFPRIKFTESISCICTKCSNNKKKHMYDISRLIAGKGKTETIQCLYSFENLNINRLIQSFEGLSPHEISRLHGEIETLKKDIYLMSNKVKCLILTEDEKTDLCRKVFLMQGFVDEEIEIHSFSGKTNLNAAIIATDMLLQKHHSLQCVVFHIDRDIDEGDEYYLLNAREKISKRGKKYSAHLFLTDMYDLESYFLNPEHISYVCRWELDMSECEDIIQKATKSCEVESKRRLYEKMEKIKEKKKKNRETINYLDIINSLDTMYEKNPEKYRYGKKVVKIAKKILQERLGKNIDILVESNEIKIPQLIEIAESINWETKV